MPIYMKYGTVNGDVTAEGFKQWIEVHSFQWGVGRAISTPVGAAKNREASAPSVSEITVTKELDGASVPLMQAALGASKAVEVKFFFTRTDHDKVETYLKYTLTNTLVSGYSVSSGGAALNESLSLNFTKIEVNHTPSESEGTGGTPQVATYDLAAAKTT